MFDKMLKRAVHVFFKGPSLKSVACLIPKELNTRLKFKFLILYFFNLEPNL